MIKSILTWGIIAGIIMFGGFYLTQHFIDFESTDMTTGMIFGYTTMFIAFGSTFFGVKALRSKSPKWGFLKAWGAALGMGVIAGIIYVLGWVNYSSNNPEVVENMWTKYEEQITADSTLTDEIKEEKLAEIEGWKEIYEDTFTMAVFTFFTEPLIPAVLFSLAFGIILRKPEEKELL